jgi:hypothetical protein
MSGHSITPPVHLPADHSFGRRLMRMKVDNLHLSNLPSHKRIEKYRTFVEHLSITDMRKNMTSTRNLVSDIQCAMGRKKRWSEDMQARFPEGTFERIGAVLIGKEDRTDFVRAAVERELRRRERARSQANREERNV